MYDPRKPHTYPISNEDRKLLQSWRIREVRRKGSTRFQRRFAKFALLLISSVTIGTASVLVFLT